MDFGEYFAPMFRINFELAKYYTESMNALWVLTGLIPSSILFYSFIPNSGSTNTRKNSLEGNLSHD